MKQTLIIPGRLPSLNEYIEALNSSYKTGAKFKRNYQNIVCWEILDQKIKPMLSAVEINYLWIEPNMKRDWDNISGFGRKVINDALVEMRILKNDNQKHIKSISESFFLNRTKPRIIVELTEV